MFIDKTFYKTLLFLLPMFYTCSTQAQRVFSKQSGEVSRSYLYYFTNDEGTSVDNVPLVIILPQKGEDARAAFSSKQRWLSVRKTVALLFPNPSDNQWDCIDTNKANLDISFLEFLITSSYSGFHTNRNQVYLIGDSRQTCLVDQFKKKYPGLLAQNLSIASRDSSSLVQEISELITSDVKTDKPYALWVNKPILQIPNRSDSIREFSWHNRFVLEVRKGGFYMLGSARTGITDKTNMDLSNAHSTFSVHATKWLNDSIAWFIDVGRLKIPSKQEMNGDNIKIGGGMVFMVSLGFKYALPRHKSRPYFSLASGFIPVMVFGGSLNASSMSSGMPPPNSSSFKAETRMALHTTLGTGIDWRFTKRLLFGAHLRYIHSANFESAGKVDAIRGFQFSLSTGYIFNANKVKNIPFIFN
ncbi:hypothetical protein [Spirosoma telluris]|uniref:Outer membrane protein beta-barrel domain-containing protein n=1 Tax=Spirosoma telluris TaxID=2183553 RepID=A0A327NM57_9BACT|nr:hypothetical protein HMF3257_17130 [Spirosoma telluris]